MKSITLLIIDESGSMAGMKDFVKETYYGIVKEMEIELDEIPDLKQFLEVWTFEGSNIKQRIPFMEISKELAPTELKYRPLGSTPLYDAMGTSLEGMQQRLKNISSLENAQVNVCIITDGLENSSRDYDFVKIQRLVTNLKETGWNFTYYGTDHDVDTVAADLQMNHSIRFQKNKEGFSGVTGHWNKHAKSMKRNLFKNIKK